MNGRTYARGTHRAAVPEFDKLSFHGKDELVAGHARAACTPHESLDRETVPSWSVNWRAASGSIYPMLMPKVFGRPSAPDASVVMASASAVAPDASTLGNTHAAARVRARRRARARTRIPELHARRIRAKREEPMRQIHADARWLSDASNCRQCCVNGKVAGDSNFKRQRRSRLLRVRVFCFCVARPSPRRARTCWLALSCITWRL
jgi:hypothetical protein